MTHNFLYEQIKPYKLIRVCGILPGLAPAKLIIPPFLPVGAEMMPVVELASMPNHRGKTRPAAFANLTDLELPNTLAYIADHALECTQLQSVTIPSQLKGIGQYAFFKCEKLGRISLPKTLESIDRSAFQGAAFEGLNLGEGISLIGDSCFMESNALRFISELPPHINTLGTYAFFAADGSTMGAGPMSISLKLPFINEISDYVFAENPYLTDVEAGNTTWLKLLSASGTFAFTGIRSVTIPDGVIKIGNEVCYKCTDIKELKLPDSLVSIGIRAFNGISATKISLPPSVREIGAGAFGSTHCCTCLEASDEQWPLLVNMRQIAGIGLRELALPDTVEQIGEEAFCNCKQLRKVVLPPSLSFCHDSAFIGCDSLKEIYFLGTALTNAAYPWEAPEGAVWYVRPILAKPLEKLAQKKKSAVKILPLPADMIPCDPYPDAYDSEAQQITLKVPSVEATLYVGFKVEDRHLPMLNAPSGTNILMARYMRTRNDYVWMAVRKVSQYWPLFRKSPNIEYTANNTHHHIELNMIGPRLECIADIAPCTTVMPIAALDLAPNASYVFLKKTVHVYMECDITAKLPLMAHNLQMKPASASPADQEYDLSGFFYNGVWYPARVTVRSEQNHTEASEKLLIFNGEYFTEVPCPVPNRMQPWDITVRITSPSAGLITFF